MKHIRQINSVNTECYVIILTEEIDFENHASILEHPEWFEIVDCEIPNDFQYLNYE